MVSDPPAGLPWWMYNPTGGPTYFERHGHRPDEPCGRMCPGSPSKPGAAGGSMSINPDLIDEWKRMDEEGGQQDNERIK
jgi:hypothetical protein